MFRTGPPFVQGIQPQYRPFGRTGGGGGATPVVTSEVLGSLSNTFAGGLGFRFEVGASDITVTELGLWVPSGSTGSRLMTLTENDGTVIESVMVDTTGAPAGAYLYAAITPAVLTSGVQYRVFEDVVFGDDSWYNDSTEITTTGDIADLGSTYRPPASSPANNSGPGFSYGPVNFKYTL